MEKALTAAIILIALSGTAHAGTTIKCNESASRCAIHSIESRVNALRLTAPKKTVDIKKAKPAPTTPTRAEDCPPANSQTTKQ